MRSYEYVHRRECSVHPTQMHSCMHVTVYTNCVVVQTSLRGVLRWRRYPPGHHLRVCAVFGVRLQLAPASQLQGVLPSRGGGGPPMIQD